MKEQTIKDLLEANLAKIINNSLIFTLPDKLSGEDIILMKNYMEELDNVDRMIDFIAKKINTMGTPLDENWMRLYTISLNIKSDKDMEKSQEILQDVIAELTNLGAKKDEENPKMFVFTSKIIENPRLKELYEKSKPVAILCEAIGTGVRKFAVDYPEYQERCEEILGEKIIFAKKLSPVEELYREMRKNGTLVTTTNVRDINGTIVGVHYGIAIKPEDLEDNIRFDTIKRFVMQSGVDYSFKGIYFEELIQKLQCSVEARALFLQDLKEKRDEEKDSAMINAFR